MEKEKSKKKELEEDGSRIIVVPGEIVATGPEFLPGEGLVRDNKDIVSIKFGVLEKTDKLLKVIPLSGVYIPRAGNTVIGQITDITFNGWIVDILSPHIAFLSLSECSGYISKKDLAECYNFRDTIVTKIKSVKSKGIDLTMREHGLKKLEGGMVIKINPTRVPRVIGRSGSMVNTIKEITNSNIVVGQNGLIWIKGKTIEDELLAKEAIELIIKKPFVDGLTEKIKEFLTEKSNKK